MAFFGSGDSKSLAQLNLKLDILLLDSKEIMTTVTQINAALAQLSQDQANLSNLVKNLITVAESGVPAAALDGFNQSIAGVIQTTADLTVGVQDALNKLQLLPTS